MSSSDMKNIFAKCPKCSAEGYVESSLVGKKIECKCGFQFEVKSDRSEKPNETPENSVVEFITEIVIPKNKLSENSTRQIAVESLKRGDSLQLKVMDDHSIGVFNLIGDLIGCLDEDCNKSLSQRMLDRKIQVDCLLMDKTELDIINQYHYELKVQLSIHIAGSKKSKKDNESAIKETKSVDEKVHSVKISCPSCHRNGFVDSRLSSKKFECSCGYRFDFSDVNYIDPWKKSVDSIKAKAESTTKNYFQKGVEELEAGSYLEGFANLQRSMDLNESEQHLLAYFIISCFLTKGENQMLEIKKSLIDCPLIKNISWWISILSIAYGFKNDQTVMALCDWFKESFKGHFKPFERAGFYYYLFRDYKKSLDAYHKSLEVLRDFNLESKEKIDYLKSLKGIAKVNYELNKIDDSIKSFKDVLEIDKNDVDSWRHLGQIYYSSKKHGLALKFIGGALNLKPNNIDLLFKRGVTRFELNDMKGAKTDFDHILELNPYDEDVVEYLEKIKLKDGTLKTQSSSNNYNSKRKQNLRSEEFSLDGSKEKDDESSKRIEQIKSELRFDSRNTSLLVEKGWLQSELGRYQDSIKSYNLALSYERFDENKSFIYNNRGLAKNAMNDYYGSIADYTEALRLTKELEGLSTCYLNRAIAKGNLNDFEGAVQDLKEGIKSEKSEQDLAYYYYLLGELLLESSKYDEAIKYLDKGIAIEKDPKKSGELYSLKGACYGSTEVFELAIENFKKAIEKNPEFAKYQINLGYAYYSKECYEDACEVYAKALSLTLDPSEASSIYFLKSIANFDLNNFDVALIDANKSIDLDADNSDYYYQRGLVHDELGNKVEARADYLKTLSIKPSHEGAKMRLSDLE